MRTKDPSFEEEQNPIKINNRHFPTNQLIRILHSCQVHKLL